MSDRIGLIAGAGRLPLLTAREICQAGHDVVCVGMRGLVDLQIREHCTQFAFAGALQIGRWIRVLRRWNVHQAVLIGKIHKVHIYNLARLFQMRPDWRTARLWYIQQRHARGDASLLKAVTDELALHGIELLNQTRFLQESVAAAGVMTQRKPSAAQEADIAYGWPMVSQLSRLEIGQAIAVHGRSVLAVEAIEGTDAMIRRAGQLCRGRAWTMLKAAHPQHDMRQDVPVVGPQTIENLHDAGARCLVVQAGRVILTDKAELLALADRYRIAVVGRDA